MPTQASAHHLNAYANTSQDIVYPNWSFLQKTLLNCWYEHFATLSVSKNFSNEFKVGWLDKIQMWELSKHPRPQQSMVTRTTNLGEIIWTRTPKRGKKRYYLPKFVVMFTHSCHIFVIPDTITSWWFRPSRKIRVKIGNLPKFSGWK